MTKTGTIIAPLADANSCQPRVMRWAQWQADSSFGPPEADWVTRSAGACAACWDLFGIWYLVLGIFIIFAKRVIFAN